MRKSLALIAVLILSLASAGAALAQFTQTATVSMTAHKGGQSTGITSDIQSSDPTAAGAKPKPATKLAITFPTRTKFDLTTTLVARCTYIDTQLAKEFGPSCPKTSQIGNGTAVANASPLAASVKAVVKAYVRGSRQIVLVLKPSLPGAPTIVIDATVTRSTLTIPVPTITLGGISVVLVSLKLTVPALGTGKTALITAGRCIGHAFVVRSNFRYADGSHLILVSSTPCR
jgi:hypothetical protein